MREELFLVCCMVIAFLLGGCNQQKPDPNIIETKLADGRVLHYTKQQLDEAKSWGQTKDAYESDLATGHTHGEIIQLCKKAYLERLEALGKPTPAGEVTPPPEMRVK